MLKVYRYEDNATYWNRRWSEADEDADGFKRLDIYPIRFAKMASKGKVLEIGCGLGRLVKHFQREGVSITGLERSPVAVKRLNETCPELDIIQGDVLEMPFSDESFDSVMAFGVYHNLEQGIEMALSETSRVLKHGGTFCISMRPLNIEMILNEIYWRFKAKRKEGKHFHKILVTEKEFRSMLEAVGLKTLEVFTSKNVSIFYRIPFLRKDFLSESERRSSGYQLNRFGAFIDNSFSTLFPYQSANVLIFLGKKI